MRPIKFRVWHEETRRMLEVYEIVFTRAGVSVRCKGNDHRHFGTKKDLPLMQFTGLLDKNGKPIYEGDIGRDNGGAIQQVIWRDDWAGFVLRQDRGASTGISSTFEILGNKWENPELLTSPSPPVGEGR